MPKREPFIRVGATKREPFIRVGAIYELQLVIVSRDCPACPATVAYDQPDTLAVATSLEEARRLKAQVALAALEALGEEGSGR